MTSDNYTVLKDFYTDSGNTHTDGTLDPLYTYTLPGGTLAVNGDKLQIDFAMEFESEMGPLFESVVTFNGSFISNDWAEDFFGSTGGNTANVNVRILLIRVSSTTIRATSTTNSNILVTDDDKLVFPSAEPPGSFVEITGLDLTGDYDIVLKAGVSGTGAAADSIVAKMGSIRKIPAAPYALGTFPPIRSYLAGAALSNNAGTPNTKVDLAAGLASDSTNTVMITGAGYTIDFSLNGAVNRLDTGTIAANTWYHLFLIAKTDGTTGGLASTSPTSPTLPTGYVYFRRVGSVKTDGTAHILSFKQVGQTFYWGTAVLDLSQVAGTTSATLQTLSVPTGVKVQPLVRAIGGASAGSPVILLTSPDEQDAAPGDKTTAPGYDLGDTNSATIPMIEHYLTTNTSAQIRTRCGSTNCLITIVTRGWIDDCGRNS